MKNFSHSHTSLLPVSFHLFDKHKFSIIFVEERTYASFYQRKPAEFSRRAWDLSGRFLLFPFSRSLLLCTNTAVSLFKIQLQVTMINKSQYFINKDIVHRLCQFTWIKNLSLEFHVDILKKNHQTKNHFWKKNTNLNYYIKTKLKLSKVVFTYLYSYFAFHFNHDWQAMSACPVLSTLIKDFVSNHPKREGKTKKKPQ